MRCLCIIVHYFNPQGPFGGRSKHQDPRIRRRIVQRAPFSLQALRDFDVRVCGHAGQSLVPLDFDFSARELREIERLVQLKGVTLLKA